MRGREEKRKERGGERGRREKRGPDSRDMGKCLGETKLGRERQDTKAFERSRQFPDMCLKRDAATDARKGRERGGGVEKRESVKE